MRRCNLLVLLLANAPALVLAANVCEQEVPSGHPDTQYYMILAGQTDVFYDRSGPAFVMLQSTAAAGTDVGAFGIYAGERRQPVFGPVPASVYQSSPVLLRLAISQPQYERVLKVLRSWERRVHENALLYPEIALDNILLVKQATEELNRCGHTLVAYDLDWGLEDGISEHNAASRIPYEYFRELARLNASRHVPDSQ